MERYRCAALSPFSDSTLCHQLFCHRHFRMQIVSHLLCGLALLLLDLSSELGHVGPRYPLFEDADHVRLVRHGLCPSSPGLGSYSGSTISEPL